MELNEEGVGKLLEQMEKPWGPQISGGLGFRDLEGFNKVLLAKKAWKLSQDLHFLARQILKEKYFHFSNIVEAKIGYNPSLIWKSIQSSITLIRDWIFWRIGDGKIVKIW